VIINASFDKAENEYRIEFTFNDKAEVVKFITALDRIDYTWWFKPEEIK
jgi:hypothetical protein